jgi:hypothetical protein
VDGEDKFRDSLEKLLAQKEFPLAEDSWEQASNFIDASRKDKKRRFIILIFSGLFLLFTGLLYFYFSDKTETVAGQKLASNVTEIKKEAALKNKNDNNDSKKQEEFRIKETAGESSAGKKANSTVSGKNKTNADKEVNKTSAGSALEKDVLANGTTKGKINVTFKKTDKQIKSGETGKIKEPVVGITGSIISVAKDPKENKIKEEPIVKKETVQPVEEIMRNGNAITKTEKDSAETGKTPTLTAINAPVKDSSAAVPVIDIKRDSMALTVQNPIITPKANTHTISAEGGIAYLAGWNYSGKKDASGYNPLIGLNYSTVIYKKITGTAGINYYSVGGLAYSSKTSKVTSYGLGEKSAVTIVTPTKLHYLGFPVRLSYAINKNHSAGLGCNVGYLLNVSAQTETYLQNFNQITEYKKSKAFGYVQGFKTFDVQLSVFYRRRIYKELSVNAEFIYGLTDAKDNVFFNSAVFERTLGVKCTLIYNIFKK